MDERDTAVGRASGGRPWVGEGPFRSRKGFGFRVRQAMARPNNTAIRDLLSDGRFTEAVLVFKGNAGGGGQGRSYM